MQTRSLAQKLFYKVLVVVLALLTLSTGVYYFIQTHFLWGTTIDGINCSLMSKDKAIYEINQKKQSETINFKFMNGSTYTVNGSEIDMQVDSKRIDEIFRQQHSNYKESRSYDTKGYVLVDLDVLKTYLRTIPQLQEVQMEAPQDAYIVYKKDMFYIKKEAYGNIIDFDEAFNLAVLQIRACESTVDFESITQTTPNVFEDDLNDKCDELNSIINTSISFQLNNGELYTLDSNIIKNWLYQDENGDFYFDIEDGVSAFVEELANKIEATNSVLYFKATNMEDLTSVNVAQNLRAYLDKEAQIAEIYELLGSDTQIVKNPIYDRTPIFDMLTSRIEIDITRQHIWFYLNGELIVDTPCVTGNISIGYDTPPGVFFLLNKNRGVYLEGYNKDGSKYKSYVEFWMRFNQGIGMHDATWRGQFGGEIYKTSGSHGCVNMPYDAAEKTYEYIDSTIPIIVYCS